MSLGLGLDASAQEAPKVGKIVVGFPAGGSNDSIARLLAEKMQGRYAETLIVENKAGAGGRLGVDAVRRAPADGGTILQTPGSILTLYPHIFKSLPYDALRDLTPVSSVCTLDFALAVGPATPARTIAEYVDWCKANPRQATYGSPAAGASPHFVGLMFGQAAGLNLLHVGYKGAAPAVQDLIGGQIPAYFGVLPDVTPHLKGGRLRVLATSGSRRSAITPDVPTFQEAGFQDLSVQEWYGMLLPGNAAEHIVSALNRSIQLALRDPEVLERFKALNVDAAPSTPEAFAERIRMERARWAPIVKASGFKMEE
ncbi:MAG: Bug family tripartite tricarboxylate transporter substrate binding protein [Ramlibacter sp.]